MLTEKEYTHDGGCVSSKLFRLIVKKKTCSLSRGSIKSTFLACEASYVNTIFCRPKAYPFRIFYRGPIPQFKPGSLYMLDLRGAMDEIETKFDVFSHSFSKMNFSKRPGKSAIVSKNRQTFWAPTGMSSYF